MLLDGVGSWAAASFLLDFTLLWATGRLLGRGSSWRRLAAAAGCGTGFFVLFPGVAGPPASAAGLALTSVAMLYLAFGSRSWRALGREVLVFYGVASAAAGAGALAAGLLGPSASASGAGGWAAALASAVAIAATGVHAVRRMAVLAAWKAQLELRFGPHTVTVRALVDTGNRLREPFGQLPVVLVWQRPFLAGLPEPLRALLSGLAGGELSAVTRLARVDARWGARVRVVPFRTVGSHRGLLLGLRADSLAVRLPGAARLLHGPAVVALSPTPLAEDGEFDALLPAECLVGARPAPAPQAPQGQQAAQASAPASPSPLRLRVRSGWKGWKGWKGGAAGAAAGS